MLALPAGAGRPDLFNAPLGVPADFVGLPGARRGEYPGGGGGAAGLIEEELQLLLVTMLLLGRRRSVRGVESSRWPRRGLRVRWKKRVGK